MKSQDGKAGFADLLTQLQSWVYEGDVLIHSASLENVDAYRSVCRYLSNKGSKHTHFRYYADIDRIKQILSGSAVYLTDGSHWNDRFDACNFNPHFSSFKRFGICMSYSASESIAMWMLYGGHSGAGAMIDFEKEILVSAMEAPCFEFGHFGAGGFVSEKTLSRDEVQIELIDIAYFREGNEENEGYALKLPFEKQAEVTGLILDNLGPFVKHESWSYEQEVRMVATVDKRLLDNRASSYKCMRLPLGIPRDYPNRRIYSSPVSDSALFCDSNLVGTVEWDLCNGCRYRG